MTIGLSCDHQLTEFIMYQIIQLLSVHLSVGLSVAITTCIVLGDVHCNIYRIVVQCIISALIYIHCGLF